MLQPINKCHCCKADAKIQKNNNNGHLFVFFTIDDASMFWHLLITGVRPLITMHD